jgi:dissimilatory sulfite reductase (desulfoviridin) alpha/beta subunit
MFNQTMKISDLNQISAIKESFEEKQNLCDQQIYNIVNISKDDAESIINLLKDYVTVDLGNGRQIKIPRLNLALLPSNFPQEKINKMLTPSCQSPDKVVVAVANQSSFQNNTTNEE